MPDASGQKNQLVLTPYALGTDGKPKFKDGTSFTAMVNPAEVTHDHSISYNTEPTMGQAAANARFSAVNPDRLRFALVLDGTGVVPPVAPGGAVKEVKAHLADLNRVVYNYEGDKHEPNHVRVLWGTLVFFGRMDSMSVRYTLFKPSGEPLRARVELGFTSTMSRKQAELLANRSSPDLSHTVLAVAGDTLPLLCDRIYGDAAYYPEVARFNGLAGVRTLRPGQRLHFPPLG